MAKRKSHPDAELSEVELERRKRQREMRQEALDSRARGEVFESSRRVTFPKRKPLEARKEEKRIARRKVENASRRRAVQTAVKKERAAAPDVVVVPIFWKGEAKQMARVLSACADAEAALVASSRRVLVDAGHKYTPGQKFAHWEHKGVLLRVEIGPREADKGWCTVARTFVAGEAAHRVERVPIGSDKLPEALAKLAALQAPGELRDQEAELLGAQPSGVAPAGAGGAARGGDDLEDDYAGPTEVSREDDDAEEEAPSSGKSKASNTTGKKSTGKVATRKKVVQF